MKINSFSIPAYNKCMIGYFIVKLSGSADESSAFLAALDVPHHPSPMLDKRMTLPSWATTVAMSDCDGGEQDR
jgi:hypothetical protein